MGRCEKCNAAVACISHDDRCEGPVSLGISPFRGVLKFIPDSRGDENG
jgi:hypothetical protein